MFLAAIHHCLRRGLEFIERFDVEAHCVGFSLVRNVGRGELDCHRERHRRFLQCEDGVERQQHFFRCRNAVAREALLGHMLG
ncbi:hypothetical protein D3C83_136410 [compost metagenome]